MNRRTLLTTAASIASIGLAGCSSNGSSSVSAKEVTPSATPTATPSDDVRSSREGAETLLRLVSKHYPENRLFIRDDGGIVVYHVSDADMSVELKEEIRHLMRIYSESLREHPKMGDLTIRSSGVIAYVSKDAALSYAQGDIKEDAYYETLAITGSDEE